MMCSGEVICNLTKEAVEKQNKVWECIFFEKNPMGYITGMFFLNTQLYMWCNRRIQKNDIAE